MVNTTTQNNVAIAAAATTAAAPEKPRVVPTAAMSVRISWGDWTAQFLDHEEHIIAAAAAGGVSLALDTVPMGSVLKMFIGPQIVSQYVLKGLDYAENILKPMGTDVPDGGWVGFVAKLVIAEEGKFAAAVGDELEPMIRLALAKVGVKV